MKPIEEKAREYAKKMIAFYESDSHWIKFYQSFLAGYEEATEWVSVRVANPEDYTWMPKHENPKALGRIWTDKVIAKTKSGAIVLATRHLWNNVWMWSGNAEWKITHWRPI